MTAESWHADFNPQRFLGRVNWELLVARNEAFNESATADARSPCLLCATAASRGILLNDKSFLCQSCYAQVALICYPEKYETRWRQFVTAQEARRLAWAAFRERFEHRSNESTLVFFGWISLLLALASPAFLILTALLLLVGYALNADNARKHNEWLGRKSEWERANPEPIEPELRHFHDPGAQLSVRDRRVLRVFNHWPGYPPFWKYLRAVVIGRDGHHCQVTGCPSRLELHVHHMKPVAEGGMHIPDNLVTLCDFHHALEPEKGHERIWADIKTHYFTLVCGHERSNRFSGGTHVVRAHLRRLQLITAGDLQQLDAYYGFRCPTCSGPVTISIQAARNIVRVGCSACGHTTEGPQQLAEETGPMLAQILTVTSGRGRWKPRWDMLAERKSATWGTWSGRSVTTRRQAHQANIEARQAAPRCPKCGAPMRLVKPWKPEHTWKAFWGCTQYATGCRGSARHQGHEG